MKEPIKLSHWSTMCMLSTTVLDNLAAFLPVVAVLILLVLPAIGTVLAEGRTWRTIGRIAMNVLLVVFGIFRLIVA